MSLWKENPIYCKEKWNRIGVIGKRLVGPYNKSWVVPRKAVEVSVLTPYN